MPRAGRWLEEAGGSRSDVSNDVQDLSTMGHVVVVGSPYHTVQSAPDLFQRLAGNPT